MSPVAAARNFNARAPVHAPSAHNRAESDDAGTATPAAAAAALYLMGTSRADISTADRVVNKETLFDLDADGQDGDAREVPLEDVLADELPEYIQVYLTPHPDREGLSSEGDKLEKIGEKDGHLVVDRAAWEDKDKEARQAAKWSDIEASLPAYKSTATLPRAGTSGSTTTAKDDKRRCLPKKNSTRVLLIVALLLLAVVGPLVAFGVVFALQKHHHSDTQPASMPVSEPDTISSSSSAPPPIAAPMTVGPSRRAPEEAFGDHDAGARIKTFRAHPAPTAAPVVLEQKQQKRAPLPALFGDHTAGARVKSFREHPAPVAVAKQKRVPLPVVEQQKKEGRRAAAPLVPGMGAHGEHTSGARVRSYRPHPAPEV